MVNVEQHVAVVGNDAFTPDRLAAELHELTRNVGARHRYHLDGQREFTENGHQLGVVDDADEPLRSRRDHLLAGERGPTPLDEHAGRGRLIGTVDIQGEIAFRIEIQFRNPR